MNKTNLEPMSKPELKELCSSLIIKLLQNYKEFQRHFIAVT